MKEITKIELIGFNEDELKGFEKTLAEVDTFDNVIPRQSINEIDQDAQVLFYLCSDDKELTKKDLKSISALAPTILIVIILKNQDFDTLLVGFKYRVQDVLSIPYDERHLTKALVDCSETLSYSGTKPISAILEKLSRMANTDEVTGLYNQRKLTQDLESTIVLHEKRQETFSVMFIDIDHFKLVNDNYGHVIGSDILLKLGNVIKKTLRDSDFIYRYGGDEFVVIIPKINIEKVHSIAGRMLTAVRDSEFEVGADDKHKLTVSIGISEYPTDATTANQIIEFADRMMYESKKSGRGKIFHVKEVSGPISEE